MKQPSLPSSSPELARRRAPGSRRSPLPALLAAGLLLSPWLGGVASAEEWSFSITPYVWVPSLDTSLNIGPNPPVESSKSIFDILNGAFLIAGEARRDRWSVFGELNWLSLGDDIDPRGGRLDASWKLEGVMASASLGYAVYETAQTRAEVFGGARLWSLDAETEVLSREASASRSWTDPILGARVETQVSDRWALSGLVDVGGFGVGSEFQWEAIAQVSWAMTDSVSLVGGYRHLDLEFEKGNFDLDLTMSGPFIAVGFEF